MRCALVTLLYREKVSPYFIITAIRHIHLRFYAWLKIILLPTPCTPYSTVTPCTHYCHTLHTTHPTQAYCHTLHTLLSHPAHPTVTHYTPYYYTLHTLLSHNTHPTVTPCTPYCHTLRATFDPVWYRYIL